MVARGSEFDGVKFELGSGLDFCLDEVGVRGVGGLEGDRYSLGHHKAYKTDGRKHEGGSSLHLLCILNILYLNFDIQIQPNSVLKVNLFFISYLMIKNPYLLIESSLAVIFYSK